MASRRQRMLEAASEARRRPYSDNKTHGRYGIGPTDGTGRRLTITELRGVAIRAGVRPGSPGTAVVAFHGQGLSYSKGRLVVGPSHWHRAVRASELRSLLDRPGMTGEALLSAFAGPSGPEMTSVRGLEVTYQRGQS